MIVETKQIRESQLGKWIHLMVYMSPRIESFVTHNASIPLLTLNTNEPD